MNASNSFYAIFCSLRIPTAYDFYPLDIKTLTCCISVSALSLRPAASVLGEFSIPSSSANKASSLTLTLTFPPLAAPPPLAAGLGFGLGASGSVKPSSA